MGCATSKTVDATTPYDLYRPPPSSFAVFDINSIEEPWLKLDNSLLSENEQKPSHVPPPLLEKLDTLESNGPRTWEEVSKELNGLQKPANAVQQPGPNPAPPKKSFSFHTVSELEKPKAEKGKRELMIRDESRPSQVSADSGTGTVRANPFILRDRMEREKEGKEAAFDKIMKSKRDPLLDFPEKCPPGGLNSVILYTTSLGGVRKTFEDCNRVRAILENHRVVFDERDVSLHSGFLAEMRDAVGGDAVVHVPRLFVKGRYLGGVVEVIELNESGRLGRIMGWAQVERGVGWQGCEGCGGARFVPCLGCGGSCKVVVGDSKERCPKCNENGLVHCPLCH